ncbi:MAG: cryptochrome/photolyase family protein, partial [Verrucomicrobiota bacterium]
MEATLIFPHQLFPEHPALKKGRQVFLIEDSLFFGDPNHPAHFHQQKLVFHRASMKAYHKQLKGKGYRVRYIDYDSELTIGHLLKTLLKSKELDLYFTDPTDFILEKRLKRFAEQHGAKLHCYENPGFLTSKSWNQEYFGSRKQRFMASYYKEQRKRLNLLVDDSGKPEGGKWSFDEDNRKA